MAATFDPIGALTGGTLGFAGNLLSGFGASKRAKKEAKIKKELMAWASQQGEQMTQKILTGKSWSALEGWVTGMFDQPVPDWMAKEAADRLRVAQTARGLAYGATPGLQEAFELTAMTEQRREALAPLMEKVAMAPITVGSQAFDFFLKQTGLQYGIQEQGPDPMEIWGQALSGGLSGFLGGSQIPISGGATGPGAGITTPQVAVPSIQTLANTYAGLPSNFPMSPWEYLPFGGAQAGGDYYRQPNITYQDLVDMYKKDKMTGKY